MITADALVARIVKDKLSLDKNLTTNPFIMQLHLYVSWDIAIFYREILLAMKLGEYESSAESLANFVILNFRSKQVEEINGITPLIPLIKEKCLESDQIARMDIEKLCEILSQHFRICESPATTPAVAPAVAPTVAAAPASESAPRPAGSPRLFAPPPLTPPDTRPAPKNCCFLL